MTQTKSVKQANIASGLALTISSTALILVLLPKFLPTLWAGPLSALAGTPGEAEVTVGSIGDAPFVTISDADGQTRIEMGLKPGGEPHLTFFGADGKMTATLAVNPTNQQPYIAFIDPDTGERTWTRTGNTQPATDDEP